MIYEIQAICCFFTAGVEFCVKYQS